MKCNSLTHKIILATLITVSASPCYAVGLGFSFGAGSEEWEQQRVNIGDRDVRNVGFVVDTAVARDKIFNYRFSFLKEENNAADSGKLDMEGYAMVHDFGFAVLQTKNIRLWLGPQLKTAYYKDVYVSSTNTSVATNVAGYGFGPVFGVNVHLPQVVSFSFTAAYHFISHYSDSSVYDDLNTDSSGLHFNAALLFRFHE